MVACGSEPEDPYVESVPCLVVEVVPTSTEVTDRRGKLAAYKRKPGPEAYLIVAQDREWVERHFRAEDWAWHRADHKGRFPIPCPETELSLAEIYEGLKQGYRHKPSARTCCLIPLYPLLFSFPVRLA